MKRLLLVCLAAWSSLAIGAGGGGHGAAPEVEIDLSNRASLQRGAATFFNYCASCHSLQFMRYGRIGEDLGLTEAQIKASFLPPDAKVGDQMSVAMTQQDGADWFGVAPPDLSLTARARGESWLYGYLKGFYVDPARPWGVNNTQFPDVSMPHVLAHLQGMQRMNSHGELHLEAPGDLDEAQYDRLVRDLVAFLVYVGEPAKLQRYSLGAKVMLFLLAFTVAAWFLKKEYWKDVH
ncbi:MAG: cytochrome c1 [Pseudomonadota bacterium]|nr:cytochrome c1 [Pseudomonadota bacterium]